MSEENTIKPTGRRYSSVEEMMKSEGVSEEVQRNVKLLGLQTKIDDLTAQLDDLNSKLRAFRDGILNGRHHLEAPCLDNDQTNAVLANFDDQFPDLKTE